MIRGAKIFFLLLALDAVRAVHQPAHVLWVLVGIFTSPLFLILFMSAPRNVQNMQIAHGLEVARGLARVLSQSYDPPPKGATYRTFMGLWGLLTDEERVEIFGRRAQTLPLPPPNSEYLTSAQLAEFAAASPTVECWVCHGEHGCDVKLGPSHPCHREGGCPYKIPGRVVDSREGQS